MVQFCSILIWTQIWAVKNKAKPPFTCEKGSFWITEFLSLASSHHDHFRAELKASKAFSKFQQLFFVSNVQKMVLWIHHHTVKNVKLFFSVISATSAKLLCYCTMRLHCFGLSWDELLTSGYCPEKYGHLDFKNATTLLGKYNSFNKIIELKNEIFETAMKNFIRWPFARDSTGHLSSN